MKETQPQVLESTSQWPQKILALAPNLNQPMLMKMALTIEWWWKVELKLNFLGCMCRGEGIDGHYIPTFHSCQVASNVHETQLGSYKMGHQHLETANSNVAGIALVSTLTSKVLGVF
jgi:hypothetical protein